MRTGVNQANDQRTLLIDKILFALVLLYGSRAWIYPYDVQTQLEIDAPLIFQFQIFAQLLGLVGIFRLGPVKIVHTASNWLMLWALVGLGAISYFWSVTPFNTFGMARAMILTLLSCMYFGRAMRSEDIMKVASFVISSIIIASVILAIVSPYGRSEGAHLGSWRGLYSHKNGFGEAASIAMIFFGTRILYANKFISWWSIVFLVSMVCCFFSDSANSMGSALAGLTGVAMVKASKAVFRGRVARQTLFFAIFFVVILLIYFVAVDLVLSLGRDLTFTGRTRIWSFYMNYVEQRPALGWGWTSSAANEVFVQNLRDFLDLPYIRSAHSAYITMLVELGYFGLTLYAAWLLSTLFGAFGKASRDNDELSLVCGAMCTGMITFGFFEVSGGFIPSLWLILVVTCTVSRKFSARRVGADVADDVIRTLGRRKVNM